MNRNKERSRVSKPKHGRSFLTFLDVFSNTQPESSASEGKQSTDLDPGWRGVRLVSPLRAWTVILAQSPMFSSAEPVNSLEFCKESRDE